MQCILLLFQILVLFRVKEVFVLIERTVPHNLKKTFQAKFSFISSKMYSNMKEI